MLKTSFSIEKVPNSIWRKLLNGERSMLHAAGWNGGMDSGWNCNKVGLPFPDGACFVATFSEDSKSVSRKSLFLKRTGRARLDSVVPTVTCKREFVPETVGSPLPSLFHQMLHFWPPELPGFRPAWQKYIPADAATHSCALTQKTSKTLEENSAPGCLDTK